MVLEVHPHGIRFHVGLSLKTKIEIKRAHKKKPTNKSTKNKQSRIRRLLAIIEWLSWVLRLAHNLKIT